MRCCFQPDPVELSQLSPIFHHTHTWSRRKSNRKLGTESQKTTQETREESEKNDSLVLVWLCSYRMESSKTRCHSKSQLPKFKFLFFLFLFFFMICVYTNFHMKNFFPHFSCLISHWVIFNLALFASVLMRPLTIGS